VSTSEAMRALVLAHAAFVGTAIAFVPSVQPPVTRVAALSIRRAAPLHLQESAGGGLAKAGSTLEQALGALPADEKYNAVLLSLLSKRSGGEAGAGADTSAIDLVREMSAKSIKLTSEAVTALLNTAVESGNIEEILFAFAAARENGACRSFATPQVRLPDKPNAASLAALGALPADERSTEVTAAATFSLGLGALLLLEVADLVDWAFGATIDAPPLQLVLVLLGAAWGVDRYARQGAYFSVLGRGWTRLFARDLQRECAVESASFLLGYLLGLPCCAFTPTAYKPLEMLEAAGASLEKGVSSGGGGGGGGAARLVDRTLIWLLAPAALEMMQYREMLQAEPSLAAQFLGAARRREATLGVDVAQGGWAADDDEERVRWAYAEARRLLQRYSGVREELQERMAAGVSAGDCANLIEEKLKNSWAAV